MAADALDEEHEEHVNHEAWVIPYADILTLLMALFVVLWAMSTVDLQKFEALASSLNGELSPASAEAIIKPLDGEGGGPQALALPGAPEAAALVDAPVGVVEPVVEVDPGVDPQIGPATPTRADRAEEALRSAEAVAVAAAADDARLDDAQRVAAERVAALGLAGQVELTRSERGLVVTVVSDRVLFAPGSADLQDDGAAVLDIVAEVVRDLPNQVAVEGHTDSRPISTARFPSNWELSTGRAVTVLRRLGERGVPLERLTAAGYGEQRPLGDNATDEGRARNRRVELVVLSEALTAD
jgi:chemotaxis protein MotB